MVYRLNGMYYYRVDTWISKLFTIYNNGFFHLDEIKQLDQTLKLNMKKQITYVKQSIGSIYLNQYKQCNE